MVVCDKNWCGDFVVPPFRQLKPISRTRHRRRSGLTEWPSSVLPWGLDLPLARCLPMWLCRLVRAIQVFGQASQPPDFPFTALLLAIFLLPESKPEGIQSTARKWLDIAGLQHSLRHKSILALLLAYFVCVLAFVQFEVTLSLLLWKSQHSIDHTPFQFTWKELCLTFAFIGFTLAMVQGAIIRPLTKRLSDFVLMQTGLMTEVVGFGLLIYAVQIANTTWLFISLGIIVSGFAFIQPSIHGLISRWTDADKQGAVLGLAQSLNAMAPYHWSCNWNPLAQSKYELALRQRRYPSHPHQSYHRPRLPLASEIDRLNRSSVRTWLVLILRMVRTGGNRDHGGENKSTLLSLLPPVTKI